MKEAQEEDGGRVFPGPGVGSLGREDQGDLVMSVVHEL